jgi:hypothetical protein
MRPKGKDKDKVGRDLEIYIYYSNLISEAVGYTRSKARELTRERFASWNISDGRIANIVCEQKRIAQKEVARAGTGR